MGISQNGAQFLVACRQRGVDMSKMCSLGQQHLYASTSELRAAPAIGADAALTAALDRVPDAELRKFGVATAWWRALGAQTLDVLDMSDFEGANVLADLNLPIAAELHGQYQFVFDGGVTEHVMNARQCLMNAAAMVAVGGHLASITPANNQSGHGIYQFGPEFFYRLLGDSGEFADLSVLLCVEGVRTRWYSVADPLLLGRRITFTTAGPADWYVLARRVSPPGAGTSTSTAQQSDYAAKWDGGGSAADQSAAMTSSAHLSSATSTSAAGILHRAKRTAGAQMHRAMGLVGALSKTAGVTPIDLGEWAAQRP